MHRRTIAALIAAVAVPVRAPADSFATIAISSEGVRTSVNTTGMGTWPNGSGDNIDS
jgi:hypothetical protein